MKAKTRMFGEIDIQEDKIITLESGMIGFPDMQKFTLIFDEEKGSKSHIMWLQSMDDPQTAFPVINPVTNTLRGDGAADDVSGSRCRQSAPKTSSATGCIPMLSSVVCSVLSDQSTGRRDSSRRASETEAARKKTQAMQTRENV